MDVLDEFRVQDLLLILTSMKGIPAFSWRDRASCRSALYGEIKAVRVMQQEELRRRETCPERQ
jgi:hypothetical protein